MYPERTLTPRTPATPPIILDLPLRGLTQERGIKIPLPKQLLQRLPIPLAQVQIGNIFENLLNEIRKLHIHFIEQNKFQRNIQQFSQINISLSTIFMTSENNKTSDALMLRIKWISEKVISVLHYQTLPSRHLPAQS